MLTAVGIIMMCIVLRQRDSRKLYQNGRSEERDRSDCCCGALYSGA